MKHFPPVNYLGLSNEEKCTNLYKVPEFWGTVITPGVPSSDYCGLGLGGAFSELRRDLESR